MKDVGTCWTSDLRLILQSFGKFCIPPQNFSIRKVCYATNEPGKVKPAKKTDKLPIVSSFSQKIGEIKNNI